MGEACPESTFRSEAYHTSTNLSQLWENLCFPGGLSCKGQDL